MNSDRRKFLKIIAMGGAAAVLGRVLGSKALALAAGGKETASQRRKKGGEDNQIPGDIKAVRRGKNVVFVDRSSGDEIFILERE